MLCRAWWHKPGAYIAPEHACTLDTPSDFDRRHTFVMLQHLLTLHLDSVLHDNTIIGVYIWNYTYSTWWNYPDVIVSFDGRLDPCGTLDRISLADNGTLFCRDWVLMPWTSTIEEYGDIFVQAEPE